MATDTTQEPGSIDPERVRKLISELEDARAAYSEARTEVDGLVAEMRQKHKEIGEVATQSVAASSKIADGQAVIAEKSIHIEDAKKHSDDVRALLDKVLTESRAVQTKVAGLESETQEASEGAKEVVAERKRPVWAHGLPLQWVLMMRAVDFADGERDDGFSSGSCVAPGDAQVHRGAARADRGGEF